MAGGVRKLGTSRDPDPSFRSSIVFINSLEREREKGVFAVVRFIFLKKKKKNELVPIFASRSVQPTENTGCNYSFQTDLNIFGRHTYHIKTLGNSNVGDDALTLLRTHKIR